MKERPSQLVPVRPALSALSCLTLISAFIPICSNRDDHDPVRIGRRLELGTEDPPNSLVHLGSLITVRDGRGRDSAKVTRLRFGGGESPLLQRDDFGGFVPEIRFQDGIVFICELELGFFRFFLGLAILALCLGLRGWFGLFWFLCGRCRYGLKMEDFTSGKDLVDQEIGVSVWLLV